MRHNKKFNHLGRTSSHRKAMLANMASSLIENKRITTTVAKAKALRTYVEPLITKAKEDSTHSRRIVFSHLQNKDAVSELFREIAVKIADRPGGYTRILKTGNRLGDNADMCIIELVDYNEAMLAAKEEAAKPKRRRSRRGGRGKKSSDDAPVAEKAAPAVKAEDPVEKVEKVNTKATEVKETKETGGEAKAEETEGTAVADADVVEKDEKEEPKAEKKPAEDSSKEKKEE